MNKLFITGIALIVAGCAGTIAKAPPRPSTAPLAFEANQIGSTVTNATQSISVATRAIQEQATTLEYQAKSQLTSGFVQNALVIARNILASNQVISEQNKKLEVVNAQVVELATNLKKIQDQVNMQGEALDNALAAKAKAEKQYKDEKVQWDDSWLGGKSHRLIAWLAGIITGLLVLDTVLWFFTQSATLNPLTLIVFAIKAIINLISGLFTPKAILGSGKA